MSLNVVNVSVNNVNNVEISREQISEVSRWARERFLNYEEFKRGSKEVDAQIRRLFPEEIQERYNESECNLRVRAVTEAQRVEKDNRARVVRKVRNIRKKVGEIAFREDVIRGAVVEREELIRENRHQPIERLREYLMLSGEEVEREMQEREGILGRQRERERLERERERLLRRREEREVEREVEIEFQAIGQRIWNSIEAGLLREIDRAPEGERGVLEEHMRERQEGEFVRRMTRLVARHRRDVMRREGGGVPPVVKFNKKEIGKEEGLMSMEEDCCICMDKHQLNSVIQGSCGHVIGKCCFEEWSKKCGSGCVTCPLCRANCNEVSEMVAV